MNFNFAPKIINLPIPTMGGVAGRAAETHTHTPRVSAAPVGWTVLFSLHLDQLMQTGIISASYISDASQTNPSLNRLLIGRL